tara:strand:+ start:130171 stop:131625 length:1455 start_codon:yes stop_codon:yes gene_type:complete
MKYLKTYNESIFDIFKKKLSFEQVHGKLQKILYGIERLNKLTKKIIDREGSLGFRSYHRKTSSFNSIVEEQFKLQKELMKYDFVIDDKWGSLFDIKEFMTKSHTQVGIGKNDRKVLKQCLKYFTKFHRDRHQLWTYEINDRGETEIDRLAREVVGNDDEPFKSVFLKDPVVNMDNVMKKLNEGNFFDSIKKAFDSNPNKKSEEEKWQETKKELKRMIYDINVYNVTIPLDIRRDNMNTIVRGTQLNRNSNKTTKKFLKKYGDFPYIIKDGIKYKIDIKKFLKDPYPWILTKEQKIKALKCFQEEFQERVRRHEETREERSHRDDYVYSELPETAFLENPYVDMNHIMKKINENTTNSSNNISKDKIIEKIITFLEIIDSKTTRFTRAKPHLNFLYLTYYENLKLDCDIKIKRCIDDSEFQFEGFNNGDNVEWALDIDEGDNNLTEVVLFEDVTTESLWEVLKLLSSTPIIMEYLNGDLFKKINT